MISVFIVGATLAVALAHRQADAPTEIMIYPSSGMGIMLLQLLTSVGLT